MGAVTAVVLAGGERIAADTVITAIDPKTALLELLDPPLAGQTGRDLAASRRSNVVQAVVHVATTALPAYRNGRPGDWNGLQSYVDRLDDLERAWVQSEAGLIPDVVPWYSFTTSAIDDTLAPPGHHTVYLACPAAPAEVRGGWEPAWPMPSSRSALDTVERRAPGFRDSIVGIEPWLPHQMMAAASTGRARTPWCSTSPSTNSAPAARRRRCPITARPSTASTSRAPAPTRPAASPARRAAGPPTCHRRPRR